MLIGSSAFSSCSALTDVRVSWQTPLSVPSKIFASVNTSSAVLHVHAGTKSLYVSDPVWGTFGTIVDDLFTGIPNIPAEAKAFVSGNVLYVDSPSAETVRVYLANGVLLHSFRK